MDHRCYTDLGKHFGGYNIQIIKNSVKTNNKEITVIFKTHDYDGIQKYSITSRTTFKSFFKNILYYQKNGKCIYDKIKVLLHVNKLKQKDVDYFNTIVSNYKIFFDSQNGLRFYNQKKYVLTTETICIKIFGSTTKEVFNKLYEKNLLMQKIYHNKDILKYSGIDFKCTIINFDELCSTIYAINNNTINYMKIKKIITKDILAFNDNLSLQSIIYKCHSDYINQLPLLFKKTPILSELDLHIKENYDFFPQLANLLNNFSRIVKLTLCVKNSHNNRENIINTIKILLTNETLEYIHIKNDNYLHIDDICNELIKTKITFVCDYCVTNISSFTLLINNYVENLNFNYIDVYNISFLSQMQILYTKYPNHYLFSRMDVSNRPRYINNSKIYNTTLVEYQTKVYL